MRVRGTTKIDVSFVRAPAGITATADLSITGLASSTAMLGNFRTGGHNSAADLTADTAIGVSAVGIDSQSARVWTGMAITKGDFGRRGIGGATFITTDDDPMGG